MIHNNQGHRGSTQESSVTKSETLSDAIDGTIGRKISFATEGLQPYVENWLRIKTSNYNALTISDMFYPYEGKLIYHKTILGCKSRLL